MRRTNQILLAAVGFILGIVAAKYFGLGFSSLLAAWVVAACGASYYLRTTKLLYVAIFLLALVLGIVRQDYYRAQQPSTTIDVLQFHKVTVTGTVVGEPYWDDKKNYVFFLSSLMLEGHPVAGELRVKSLVSNAREGYTVAVYGKILPSLGKASSQISYAKATVISTRQSWLVQIKTEFSAGLRRALPEPAASFMLGILIGVRSTLPRALQNVLAIVGLSHLVAVSGYNLTIITLGVQRLLGKKWQWGGLAATLWLIVGFVLLTGASASIVRAGVMSTLFLLATYYGRKLDVAACLGLGLIITLAWNPANIVDLGWQLSFLALAGIVFLTPAAQAFIPKRFGILGEIAAVSLAAQLATMPLIAAVFGSVSVIAPLANVLVMPLVPLLMLLGFGLGLVGMLVPSIAYVAGQPASFLLSSLLDALSYLAHMSSAGLVNSAPPPPSLAIFYILLATIAALVHRRSLGDLTQTAIITGIRDEKPHERT